MRIAIVAEVFLPKIDGVVNRTLNLIRHLTLSGDALMLFCPRARGCTDCTVPVVDVPSFSFPLYPEYRVGLPDRGLARALREFAPEVIHYINPFAFGFRFCDVLRQARVQTPTVFSFHTLYGEFVKQYKGLRPLSAMLWWLTREYHNRADVNLTVSPAMREDLIRRGFRRVELWPPAVDSELFNPSRRSAAMRARLSGGRTNGALLLTVSRLAVEKNVGFLADVLRQLPGASLAIVGDGPQRAELELRFAGSDTRFLGYLTGPDLAAAYASADAFVYASETETMGNVVLEAMACGCPVIAPRAGGIPDLVSPGTTGFLYRPGDLGGAVRQVQTVLADESLRSSVTRAARQAIEQRNWGQSVGRVRQVYAEAIREGQRSRIRWNWRDRVAQTTMTALVSTFRSVVRQRKSARRPAIPLHPSPAGGARTKTSGQAVQCFRSNTR
jgi:glycosyltransferase involved in cell wall biosynthesis